MGQRDVIAIGGSLGAIDAVRRICAQLPADLPATVLVAVHLSPDSPGVVASIIGEHCALPTSMAMDNETIVPGHIYVAPANTHLLLMDDTLRLGRGPRENLSRPAIDPLFRSVALSCGVHSIGILVTGMLDDGAAGLADIKRCGGMTIVQNPVDAVAPSMPRAALLQSDVDYRASIADMGPLIVRLLGEERAHGGPCPPGVNLEVEIALGRPSTSPELARIAEPVALSCPACGGVLSQINGSKPIRFRCQVGHGFTGAALMAKQESTVDEAMRVALRIIEERAVLTEKMAAQARDAGRDASASSFDERALDYRKHAAVLRDAILQDLAEP